jgi:hypothetical protein
MGLILGVVIINVAIGLFQEGKAEKVMRQWLKLGCFMARLVTQNPTTVISEQSCCLGIFGGNSTSLCCRCTSRLLTLSRPCFLQLPTSSVVESAALLMRLSLCLEML